MIRIPTSTDPKLSRYVQRTRLGRRDYLLTFDWNGRDNHWYLSIALEDQTPVVSGVKLVVGTPLLRSVPGVNRPEGDILAIDTTGKHGDPTLETLGSSVLLMYVDPTDVVAVPA